MWREATILEIYFRGKMVRFGKWIEVGCKEKNELEHDLRALAWTTKGIRDVYQDKEYWRRGYWG